MKHIQLTFILLLSFLFFGCSAGRKVPVSEQGLRIIIKEEPYRESNTNEQLRNMVKKMRAKGAMPQIVVRSTGTAESISSTTSSDRICSIFETALAKNNFDVRDRALFENIVNTKSRNSSGALSYNDLHKATNVDLLMEITDYSLNDQYLVEGYYDRFGRYSRFTAIDYGTKKNPQLVYPRYIFRGMSISIKVIMLGENLVGGSYTFSYVPCSEESGGAKIIELNPLRYRPASSARDIDAVLSDSQNTALMESKSQRLNRELEEFLSNTVAPNLLKYIEGDIEQGSQSPDSRSSSSGQEGSQMQSIPSDSQQERPSVFFKNGVLSIQHIRKQINNQSEEESPASNSAPTQQQQTIIAQNSGGKLISVVTEMIDNKVAEQAKEEREKIKELTKKYEYDQKVSELKTTYEKLCYLDSQKNLELMKFVLSSISPAGTNPPETDENSVSFFCPMFSREVLNDIVYYLFLDKRCIGVGSFGKGFYVCYDANAFSSSFHKLEIVIKNANFYNIYNKKFSNNCTIIYNSDVRFDIRKQYTFKSIAMAVVQLQ